MKKSFRNKHQTYIDGMKDHPANIWTLLFYSHKDALFKRLRRTIIILVVYSIIAVSAQALFDKFFDRMAISNLGQFHLIFSFVISILIAFRVNSSYARWWEGRGQWGSLVNNSRNLALKFNNFIGLNREPLFAECLKKFPLLLQYNLRKQSDNSKNLLKNLGISFNPDDHLPSVVVNYMYSRINYYRVSGQIALEQYLAMDIHLANMIDVVGGCEKIVNTPIPAPFKIFVNQALYFYMVVFPFGWAETFGLLIIPIVIVFIYVLQGMEILAEDMEDPFEKNYCGHNNNLPLEAIANAIERNVESIICFNFAHNIPNSQNIDNK